MITPSVFLGPEGPRFHRYRESLGLRIRFSKSIGLSSREPGRTKRPTDLPDSTRRRHWEPCHRGQKLPRLTLIYFGIAVYCGKYVCRQGTEHARVTAAQGIGGIFLRAETPPLLLTVM